uniref:FHA domain-containing protein n=1 Tax=Gouania willdenowi TaxID=441366 RepID=A0A8C5HE61_GOUWI
SNKSMYVSADFASDPCEEFPLFLGENVLGRDPSTCTLLLSAPSVSKQHATIRSMNGTHKGRLNCGPGAGSSQADANTIGSTNSGVEDSVTEEGRKDTSISGLRQIWPARFSFRIHQ